MTHLSPSILSGRPGLGIFEPSVIFPRTEHDLGVSPKSNGKGSIDGVSELVLTPRAGACLLLARALVDGEVTRRVCLGVTPPCSRARGQVILAFLYLNHHHSAYRGEPLLLPRRLYLPVSILGCRRTHATVMGGLAARAKH